MHANPNVIFFIHKNIHIMIPTSYCSQLFAGHCFIFASDVYRPRCLIVKKFMVHLFIIFPANTKGKDLPDVIHDLIDIFSNFINRNI